MPNNFGNSYSTHFTVTKTSKPIEDIKEKISDRLIITKSGRLYFDYSDSERIEISNKPESYRYNGTFGVVNKTITVDYSYLYDYDGVSLSNEGKTVVVYTSVYDLNGNIGVITKLDPINQKCDILALTDAVSLTMLNEYLNVHRFIY